MGLFSLLAVLLLEHLRPLPYPRVVREPLSRLAGFLEGHLNAGQRSHGQIAWLLAVGLPVLLTAGVYALLQAFSPLLGWVWNVAVLYLAMGFRQSSDCFTDIQLALRMNDLPHARSLLAGWRGYAASDLSASDVARQSIEQVLITSHRHVFAILVCFVLLPGPCGAVLYRLAALLDEVWGRQSEGDQAHFGRFSQQAFALIDWLPLRITAAAFAVVGNFEDAVYCWRAQAGKWLARKTGKSVGIVLACGAGALGVRLTLPEIEIEIKAGVEGDPAEMTSGREADVDCMQSAMELIWRALWLWALLLLLLGFARLVAV
jgi:adenosylcobinamide-phosphate synthase